MRNTAETSTRGSRKAIYQMVGRYLDGNRVSGYHLQSLDTGKAGRYSKEQVYFLIGRDQISNCEGRLGPEGSVQINGVGMRIQDLPTRQEDGRLTNTESIGRVRKQETADDIMNKLRIIAQVPDGRRIAGYWLENAGHGKILKSREEVIEMAKINMISNARVQNYNGKVLLRAKPGSDLNSLPAVDVHGRGLVRS